MRRPGAGRHRTVPEAICHNRYHRGSHVTGHGTYWRGDRHYRTYRCEPRSRGQTTHYFSVVISDDAPQAAWSPPPTCRQHRGSHVVRAGTYGKSTPKPRQRYLCTPADGSPRHRFTPALPRHHVYRGGETCEECGEPRGAHHGEPAVARRHAWPARIVAQGLEKVSSGMGYGAVSAWATRTGGVRRRRRKPAQKNLQAATTQTDPPARKRRRPSPAGVRSHKLWHIAADWTETLGPVVWQDVERRLRERAMNERARLDALTDAGRHLERPQVIVIDDVPVYAEDKKTGRPRRDDGFFVLALAEVSWEPDEHDERVFAPDLRLRLLRAMPKSNAPAWRLCFDELGYAPDFIVADAGTGIAAAVAAHFDPARTRFVPSIWHVGQAIRNALAKTPGAKVDGRLREDLRAHLAQLGRDGALTSPEAWVGWWDGLEAILTSTGLPLDRVRIRRRNYETAVLAVLPDLLADPGIAVSSGGLENLLQTYLDPVLHKRRSQFANIERTNTLLDLVVARAHGAFDDPRKVAELLRRDATAHDGWGVPLRAVADPRPKKGRYSSLRDGTLLTSIAHERGVA